MPRYIEGPEIRLSVRDRIFLDAEFFDGTKMEELEPHRLFPVSGPSRYVALMDGEGDVVCIVVNVDALLPDSREAMHIALNEQYMIPKIQKVIGYEEKYGINKWTVETTHGRIVFEVVDNINAIKRLYNDRVLIKDASDNRYEIPDLNALDSQSLRLIMPDL